MWRGHRCGCPGLALLEAIRGRPTRMPLMTPVCQEMPTTPLGCQEAGEQGGSAVASRPCLDGNCDRRGSGLCWA